MNTIDVAAESREGHYRALRPKLEPMRQELLDRLFREFKHYGEEAWFDRHLQFLEAEVSPKAKETRQAKMKVLRAATLKSWRSRRRATIVTPAGSPPPSASRGGHSGLQGASRSSD